MFDWFKKSTAAPTTGTAPVTSSQGGINLEKQTQKINLLKGRAEIVSNISLRKGINNKSRVAFAIDRSGSMDWLYDNGTVQDLFERLFPVAVTFDDNGSVDLFAFHNNNFDLGEVDTNAFMTCIKDRINHISYGGTNYAPTINDIVKKYKNTPGDPVYVIFVTDGDCGDKPQSKQAMVEASKYGIFFQFVGIGNAGFSFLDELDTMSGRTVDNANFFQANDISKLEDKELYVKLMSEYPQWLKEANSKGIIHLT